MDHIDVEVAQDPYHIAPIMLYLRDGRTSSAAHLTTTEAESLFNELSTAISERQRIEAEHAQETG